MTGRRSLLDRRALFATGAAAALLAATGVSAAGAPRRGGRLRLALSGAQRSDGWTSGDGIFMQVARQGLIFDTLTELAADGTLHGELATAWQSFEGGREWRFDLRPGVRFHDGSPLRARDVAVSLVRMLGHNDTVQEAGQRQIIIALDTADPGLPLRLSEPAYVIRPADQQDGAIGSGLYRVRRFSAGQQLIATRVGAHYKDGRAGWFDEVELVSVPRDDIRAQAFAEGMVEAADLGACQHLPEGTLLPGGCGASRKLAQPAQIGTHWPMDNLRAAERWWFA